MDYLRKFAQNSLSKSTYLWNNTQISKKPSQQLLYQLRHQKLTQQEIEHYKQILKTKFKIEHENPLKNKAYPEEDFIPTFYSTQSESYFDSNKYKLHTYRYKSVINPVKAVCILLHGMNWHSNLLAHMADELAQNGIEVCAYDFKGYGKSEGLKGYLPDFKTHMDDAHLFVDQISQMYPNKPIFLCGFSLGGLTAFHLGLEKPEKFKGIVFFAPALKDHPYFRRHSKILSRFIARYFPKLRVTPKGRTRSAAQRNKVIDDYLQNMDDLYYKGGLRAGTIRSICEAMMDTEHLFQNFNSSFLLFQGGLDRLVDPNLANILHQQSPSKDKEIIYNPDVWHGIPLEPEIDQYIKHVVQWIHMRS